VAHLLCQHFTVAFSDILLRSVSYWWRGQRPFIALALVLLLAIDHVHFQYNGFLVGLLLLSLYLLQ
jgi:alpha-1,3-glucosyltransferase